MRIHDHQLADDVFNHLLEASAVHTFRSFRESPRRLLENFPAAMLLWSRDMHAPPRVRMLGNTWPHDQWTFMGHHAFEKHARLITAPICTTAWESRDESHPDPLHHKYGGGFKVRAGTFVVSGFDEPLEDYFLVETLYNIGCITDAEIIAIIKATGNPHIQRVHSGLD